MKARQEAIQKQEERSRKAAELQQMIADCEKVNDESRRTSLLDTLCSTDDVLSMPTYQGTPPGIATGELTVDLLKHQLQALKWCIENENPVLPTKETDKPVQFWQFRKHGYEVRPLSEQSQNLANFVSARFHSLFISIVRLLNAPWNC